MDDITVTATNMAKQISELIKNTEKYREYQEAKKVIHEDKNLHKKVREFISKHTAFLYAMKDGTASFEQERYLAQEFHKLMLNRNVYVYMTATLEFTEMLATVFQTSVADLDIDMDF